MKRTKLFSTLGLAAFMISSTAYAADAKLNADQVDQVKQIIHDYLVGNPQVLVEASEALQKQTMDKAIQGAQAAITANAKSIFADPNSPVAGNPKGDVTLVEFFDYQCPHCKDMKDIVDQVKASDPNLRIVYKELPIFGGASRDAALAALAAYQQGADLYLKFHDALLSESSQLDKDKIMAIAKSVGLNTDKLAQAMNNDALKQQVDANFNLAKTLQLMGTPTFIVTQWQVGNPQATAKNPVFMPGVVTVDNLKDAISKSRKPG